MTFWISDIGSGYSYDGAFKPRKDMVHFLGSVGFKPFPVYNYDYVVMDDEMKEQINNNVQQLKKSDVLLFQTPAYGGEDGYEDYLLMAIKKRGVKLIAFLHDIDILRGNGDTVPVETLKRFDMLIVAQKEEIDILQKYGIQIPYVICGPWDYASYSSVQPKHKENVVYYAGNLTSWKSGNFLSKLPKGVQYKIYGDNLTTELPKNATYMGKCKPEDLPSKFSSGFGLVWDNDISGENTPGSYLHYNWSYKLSSYVIQGLPVIVWSKSNAAEFVTVNNIGITIDSLEELPETVKAVSSDNYDEMVSQSTQIAVLMRNGYFIKQAAFEAIAKM